MIPLKDTIPSRTFPIGNTLLIVLNIVVYIYQVSLGPRLNEFIGTYGLVPFHFNSSHVWIDRWLPLVTSMFLHGGLFHVAGNMLYLYIFGDNVEDRLGHGRYLLFYLLTGALAGLSQVQFSPVSPVPIIGASGAVAGVLGAYFFLFPRARVLTLVPFFFFIQILRIPAFFFLLFWFLMQFLYGASSLAAGLGASGGVAWWAHVGGFLAGVFLVMLLKRRPGR